MNSKDEVHDTTNKAHKQQEAEAKQTLILSRILSHDARDRLNRVAIVKPERAKMVQAYLIQLAQSGNLTKIVDDQQLISLLAQLGSPAASESEPASTFIRRKNVDDDDEELDLSQFGV